MHDFDDPTTDPAVSSDPTHPATNRRHELTARSPEPDASAAVSSSRKRTGSVVAGMPAAAASRELTTEGGRKVDKQTEAGFEIEQRD